MNLLRTIASIRSLLLRRLGTGFRGTGAYWEERYAKGGTSGSGSYGQVAEFKAEIINEFVRQHGIRSIIEHGCGDGNQLRLASYPSYHGLDVSSHAIDRCRRTFCDDPTKTFALVEEYRGQRFDLALSLDVIFHLVEDESFEGYMHRLFDSAERFVIVYSSDTDARISPPAAHVRHRKFSRWIETHAPSWGLREHIPNRYPYVQETDEGSFSEFFIYERAGRSR